MNLSSRVAGEAVPLGDVKLDRVRIDFCRLDDLWRRLELVLENGHIGVDESEEVAAGVAGGVG